MSKRRKICSIILCSLIFIGCGHKEKQENINKGHNIAFASDEQEDKNMIDSSNVDGYEIKEINSILRSRFGVNSGMTASIDKEDEYVICNEQCYGGTAYWNNGKIVRGFFVGKFSGNIYNDREEKVGELKTFEIYSLE